LEPFFKVHFNDSKIMKPTRLFLSVSFLLSSIGLVEAADKHAKSSSSEPRSEWISVKSRDPSSSAQNAHGKVLGREELAELKTISKNISEMMTVTDYVHTDVWPHAVRDSKGRAGVFVSCSYPILSTSGEAAAIARESWVTLAVIAAVKYSEGSVVPLQHLAFTDPNGETQSSWYYDLDMDIARYVHRQLVHGGMSRQQAYAMVERSWVKVTNDFID
jgi:hypothetical protein